jgi:predicted nucleotidyltransferase
MRAIRKFARQVAERFQPDKIILFGSYAYGTPHEDSDVDILIIMPSKRGRRLSVDIRMAIPFDYAMDLLVRKPEEVEHALAEGQHFWTEVITRGKVLYAKAHPPLGPQGRVRLPRRKPARKEPAAGS